MHQQFWMKTRKKMSRPMVIESKFKNFPKMKHFVCTLTISLKNHFNIRIVWASIFNLLPWNQVNVADGIKSNIKLASFLSVFPIHWLWFTVFNYDIIIFFSLPIRALDTRKRDGRILIINFMRYITSNERNQTNING